VSEAAARIREIGRSLEKDETGLGDAAQDLLTVLGADRVSLSAIDADSGTFEIVEARGETLLGRGTCFPLETSTHHERAAAGTPFVAADFDRRRGFSRPLDRIVRAHGFRAGASLPLGRRAGVTGALNLHFNEPGDAAARASELLAPILDALSVALARPEEVVATSVLVCHDDPLVGRGIARLLEEYGRVETTVARSRADALAAAPLRAPDVLIGDEALAGARIESWVADLRRAGVDAPLLVIAARGTRESLAAALAAGAAGYVTRLDVEASLHLAVEAIARGQTWLPPRFEPRSANTLTPRELEVLECLDRGLRFREIADTLGVSQTTVKTHARSLFRKLDSSSRSEATYAARQRGLLR
jgi:DNA-binding NarL/FixJ family response regulator